MPPSSSYMSVCFSIVFASHSCTLALEPAVTSLEPPPEKAIARTKPLMYVLNSAVSQGVNGNAE